jgi:hypothetical protein
MQDYDIQVFTGIAVAVPEWLYNRAIAGFAALQGRCDWLSGVIRGNAGQKKSPIERRSGKNLRRRILGNIRYV